MYVGRRNNVEVGALCKGWVPLGEMLGWSAAFPVNICVRYG